MGTYAQREHRLSVGQIRSLGAGGEVLAHDLKDDKDDIEDEEYCERERNSNAARSTVQLTCKHGARTHGAQLDTSRNREVLGVPLDDLPRQLAAVQATVNHAEIRGSSPCTGQQ